MGKITTEEFKYFVINTPDKWRNGFSDSTVIDQEGSLSLTPMQSITQVAEGGQHTGIAVDKRGDLFIIEATTCQILKYSFKEQVLNRVNCFGGCGIEYGKFGFSYGRQKTFSGGLAFGKLSLYIADTSNHRVQAFYLPGYQIRFVLGKEVHGKPASGTGMGEFNHPRDIVTDRTENIYVLDYGNHRIQKFNKFGRFLQYLEVRDKHVIQQPESIAIDRDDFVYVVDSVRLRVEKFDRTGNHVAMLIRFDQLIHPIQPSGIAVGPNGIIYIGEMSGGDDLRIHQFDPTGTYLGHFGSYSGRCFKLTVDRQGRLYGSCGAVGQVFLFSDTQTFEKEGTYFSQIFDSTIPGCNWHRIALDIIPARKARLDVFFHTSDTRVDRSEIEQNQAWVHLMTAPHNSVETDDALFFEGVGRYLQLKFDFFGDGFGSYKVKQAQVYFERLSYLRYLPAVYQEDEESRNFLERFLSIFESMSFEVEQNIKHIARYFDSTVVEGEFLEWLGSWLAIIQDGNWPEPKRRKLLENAFQLFKKRGTLQGLKEMIELFTEGKTAIIEHHSLQTPIVLTANSRVGRSTVIGKRFIRPLILEETSRVGEFALKETEDPAQLPFEINAFDFTILADTARLDNNQLIALHRLVEEEKPAHTRCFLRTGKGDMQLGKHAFLEVDTMLSGGYKPMKLGLTSHLGKRTFLGTKFCRKGTIGTRSRIAMDAILN